MKKILIPLFLIFATLCSAVAHAITFSEMQTWDSSKLYKRGELVKIRYDMYMSVLPTRGDHPERHPVRWRKIHYSNFQDFEPRRLYFLGKVVEHEGQYFISRGINVPPSSRSLGRTHRWLEFTHPGLFYEIPDYDDGSDQMNTLVGIDNNHNGIRDDYEESIIFSDLPESIKPYALAAGKAYGGLIESATDNFQATPENARTVLEKLMIAEACKREMQEIHQGQTWQETSYFNTLDRIEAKYKLQNMLVRVADGQDIPYPENATCNALSAL